MNFFIVFLFLAMSNILIGQDLFSNPLVLNRSNGLPTNFVTAIAQDEFGFAWIGTSKGIARYDGTELRVFQKKSTDSTSINGNYIWDIIPEVTKGKVWVAHQNGLSYFDIKTEQFYNFLYDPKNPNSIKNSKVQDILKDRHGDLWVSTMNQGILKYRPKTNDFQHFDDCLQIPTRFNETICEKGFSSLCEDISNDSILYIGAKGINIFNKYTGEFQHFNIDFKNPKKNLHANIPLAMHCHQNGKVYYGTLYYGFFEFDPKKGEVREIKPQLAKGIKMPEMVEVREIVSKSEDELWITTTSGLFIYKISNNTITKNYKNDKENAYGVSFVDETDRVWFGSPWNGFQLFNPLLNQSELLYFEEEATIYPSFATRIVEDTINDRLYVCAYSSRGLYKYEKKTKQWQIIPPPTSYNLQEKKGFQSWDICLLENGQVLVLEDEKLYYYEEGFSKLKLYPLQIDGVYPRYRSIIKHSNGDYWVTSELAPHLQRLDIKNQKLVSYENQLNELKNEKLTLFAIEEDANKNIWMLDLNGLVVYDYKANNFIYHEFQNPKLRSSQNLGRILESDKNGKIWIAPRTSFIANTSLPEIKNQKINILDNSHGFKGNDAMNILSFDDDLVIITDVGIQAFDLKEWKFKGLYSKRYWVIEPIIHSTLLSDGNQMVVGNKKYIAILTNRVKTNEEAPVPYFHSFKVFDQERKLSSIPFQKDSIYLSYKENFFSFDFSSIAFSLPDLVTYKYKLEGFDDRWYDGSERRFKSYTNIPGGEYIFKIKAFNNEGVSRPPAEVYLFISTVWWKTYWFWTIAFLGLVGIAYLVYKWRVSQIVKEERLRSDYERKLTQMEMGALRAQMNPHFIFNAMNSIEYYIISNEPEKASDYLNRFSRLIRLILQNSKSTIVPLKDDLEALKLYIEIESLRFDDLFDYEVKIDKDINAETTQIPPMLLQPYVENAIWHGLMQKKDGQGKIDLAIRREKNALICVIEDNGIGREAAEKIKSKSGSHKKSFGMKITSDRLEALNQLTNTKASVKIFDLKNNTGEPKGTKVELIIPL